jgi:D-beta-D-heptose 7-phosphate kinase / D-beta-D-heptose 1-phosphate adenosyltransferase
MTLSVILIGMVVLKKYKEYMMIEIPDYSKARVLIFGDVMLDRYWYGDTKRISPEAPVPVVNVYDTQSKAGGAANVGLNVVALGAKARLFGVVGDDVEGVQLEGLLTASHIECYLSVRSALPTVTKLRVLGQNQQLIRLDFEKSAQLTPTPDIIEQYKAALDETDVVVLSDYAKGALVCADVLIEAARAKNIPVLVDPKSLDFNQYRGATILTPNLAEFESVVGACDDQAEFIEKARALAVSCDIEALLITLGKKGMILVPQEGDVLQLSAQARDVFDVTGAGDTVIGVLAASMAAGRDWASALEFANTAAGLVVAKLGAETISPAELRRALQRRSDSHLGVLTEEELVRVVLDAREHGESIVMTNGCFDILHAGHVQYLQQAKHLGKRLIVAVNNDASVRALKGHGRPLNTVEERMDVLAALRSVDWVVSFSEDTPQRLISRILPDILVKGGDYAVDEIAGAKEVMDAGGHVEVLSFKPGCSTTSLVQKIKKESL